MSSRSNLLAISAIVCAMLGVSVVVYALWRRDETVVREHHFVEWMQVVFLLGAAASHAWQARIKDASAAHLVLMVLALFCTSLAVREVDIEELGSAAIMPEVEIALRIILVVAWVIVAWQVLRIFDVLWSRRFIIALSGVGLITLAGCLFYGASWPFDKYPQALGGRSVAMLIEETVQLNATILLFIASCCALPRNVTMISPA